MEKNTWNPLLRLFMEIKASYLQKFNIISYEPIKNSANGTCVNRWVTELDDPVFTGKLSGLRLWQYKKFIIAHYTDFYALDEKGEKIDYKNMFSAYNGLYMECRGIIIDIIEEKLVNVPFRKFFNIDENEDTSMKNVLERAKHAKIFEVTDKMDGSMISASYYENEIVIGASGCNHPDYSEEVRNAYAYVSAHPEYQTLIKDFEDKTCIFESIFPKKDPHIVVYENPGLYLTGIRDNETGKEYTYEKVLKIADEYKIPSTIKFNKTLDEILNELDAKKAAEAEGFVLNIDGLKVKVKYNDYVKIHRATIEGGRMNSVIKALADGTFDDLYSKIPDAFKPQTLSYAEEITDLVKSLDNYAASEYEKVKELPIKEAMLAINKNVKKCFRGSVTAKYKNKPYNFLRSKIGHYIKYQKLLDLKKKINS